MSTTPDPPDVDPSAIVGAGERRDAIENLLFRYAQLADDLNAAGVAELLSAAVVRIGEREVVGVPRLVELYGGMFAGTPDGRHLLSNIAITATATGAESSCRYQRWNVSPPTLASMGRYDATFTVDAGRWSFTSLRIVREWAAA